MKSRMKNRNHNTAAPAPAPTTLVSRRGILLAVLAVVVACSTWAYFEIVVWSRLPAQLVGKWVVVQGPPEYKDAVFDFYRNGTMEGRVNVRGDAFIIKARVWVEGDKIHSSSKQPKTGQEITQVQTIRTLTDSELVLEDDQGKVMRFQRASP